MKADSRNHIGVWIDMKKAVIINLLDDLTNIRTIDSEIEPRERFPGETGQESRFGGQATTSEKSKKSRLNHDIRLFLKTIVETLPYRSPIVLFGPASSFEIDLPWRV